MPRRIDLKIDLNACPEQVWEAWTAPECLAGWFVDKAEGEPIVGSDYRWIWEDFDSQVRYRLLEAEPGRRIVLGFPTTESRLEIIIQAKQGQTILHLVNSGFRDGGQWDDEFVGFVNGWTFALQTLKVYMEQYWRRPKQSLVVFRRAAFEYSRLADAYRNPEQWLDLGVPLPSTVLANAGREVCFRWEALQGILELKSFESPPGRTLGLRVVSWASTPIPAKMKRAALASVGRLIQGVCG